MRKIFLRNKRKYALVDNKDYELLIKYNWHVSKFGYVTHSTKDKFHTTIITKMHKLIMGTKIDLLIDHINGNKLDNRRSNLRFCTKRQNCMNSKIPKNNTSGYKGVHKHIHRKRIYWRARIGTNMSRLLIGSYNTPLEAALAYDKSAIKYYGKFARLNFPTKGR